MTAYRRLDKGLPKDYSEEGRRFCFGFMGMGGEKQS